MDWRPTGTKAHFCTASVVDSATLDLLLTAAHCVYGSGGYAWQSFSPYDSWSSCGCTCRPDCGICDLVTAHLWTSGGGPVEAGGRVKF